MEQQPSAEQHAQPVVAGAAFAPVAKDEGVNPAAFHWPVVGLSLLAGVVVCAIDLAVRWALGIRAVLPDGALSNWPGYRSILLPIAVLVLSAAFGMLLSRTIAARRRAEQVGEARLAQLHSIFRAAPAGIGLIRSRFFLEVNDWVCKMTGYSRDELIGHSSLMLYPSREEFERVGRDKYAQIEKHGIGTLETQWKKKDGTIIDLLLSSTPIDPSDYSVGVTFTALDITEIRNAQLEREKLIASLETQNVELERFTYAVSHDLKSPLITIRGYLGLLADDIAAGNCEIVQEDLRRIDSAAQRMGSLLDELLELSRVGRLIHEPEWISLEQLVDDAMEMLEGRIANTAIEIHVQEALPAVYGDRQRLVEIFQNLIENAIKYMGDCPHPRIDIGAENTPQGTLCFVRDNGIGIDPRFQERVFRLFDKLDPSSEGSGIGLAMVKRIVEVHGGRVWIESQGRGCGSTFRFTLPAPSKQKAAL